MVTNKRKIALIVVIITIICMFSLKSYADLDLLSKGIISITLKNNEEVIKNAQITIYKVASAEIKNDNIDFAYNETFKNFEVNVNDINDEEYTQNLAKYALKNNAKGITKSTNELGKVEFSELETGLYLVVQTKSVDNYYDFKPYLVKIPYDENGTWKYNVSSEPKIEKKEQQSNETQNKPQGSGVLGDNDENENKKPSNKDELIQTGQNNWPIIIFSFVGMVCIFSGLIIIARRRDNEN